MRTYYQGPTYTVEFDETDTSCFTRHTDAGPDVVGGRGAFVFDSLTGDLVKSRGQARGRQEMEWLAFSQDAQDVARDELRRHGVAVNPYGFGCDIPEISNPKEGGDAEVGRIVVMQNPGIVPTRVQQGEEGRIVNIDDDGTIYVEWEGGESSSLAADDTWDMPTAWNPEPARISRTRGVKTMRGPYSAKKGYKPWITRRGKLGEGFLTTMSKKQRESSLDRCVKAYGYRSCLGSIMVLERAKTGPRGQGEGVGAKYGKKLEQSRNYLKKEYGGVGSFGPREKRAPARRAAEEGPGYDAGEVAMPNPVHRLVVTASDDRQAAARGRRFGRVIAVQAVGPNKWHVTVDQRRVAPNPRRNADVVQLFPQGGGDLFVVDDAIVADFFDYMGPEWRSAAVQVVVDLGKLGPELREATQAFVADHPRLGRPDPRALRGRKVPGPGRIEAWASDLTGKVLIVVNDEGKRARNPGPDEHARRAHAYLREGQDVIRRAMEHWRATRMHSYRLKPQEFAEACAYGRDAHRFALLAGHEVEDSTMKGADAKHLHEGVAQLKGSAEALLDDLECTWTARASNPSTKSHYDTALELRKDIDLDLGNLLPELDQLAMYHEARGLKSHQLDRLLDISRMLTQLRDTMVVYNAERDWALAGVKPRAGARPKQPELYAKYLENLPVYYPERIDDLAQEVYETYRLCAACKPQWREELVIEIGAREDVDPRRIARIRAKAKAMAPEAVAKRMAQRARAAATAKKKQPRKLRKYTEQEKEDRGKGSPKKKKKGKKKGPPKKKATLTAAQKKRKAKFRELEGYQEKLASVLKKRKGATGESRKQLDSKAKMLRAAIRKLKRELK